MKNHLCTFYSRPVFSSLLHYFIPRENVRATYAGDLGEVADSFLGDMYWGVGHCCTALPCSGQLGEASGHADHHPVDDYSHDD